MRAELPLLATPRLLLEPLSAEHAAAMFDGMHDTALFEWLDDVAPLTVGALKLRYGRITAAGAGAPDRWLNWAMRLRQGGEYTGHIEITLRPDGNANLAYFTFTRFMRQGYAREACDVVLDALRTRYGAREVVATMDVRNEASWRLVEALGFVRDPATEASSLRGVPTVDYRYRLDLRRFGVPPVEG